MLHSAFNFRPRHNRLPVYFQTHAKDLHCKSKWQLSIGNNCQLHNCNNHMYDSIIFNPPNYGTDNVNSMLVLILNLSSDQTSWWQNRETLVIKRYKHKCIQTIEMSLCSNKSIHETSKHMMPCTGTIETYTANRNKLYNLTFEWDSIVIIHRNHWWSIWWNIGPCRKVRRLSWRIIDSFLRNKYKSNWWAFGDWRNRYSTDKKNQNIAARYTCVYTPIFKGL